MYNNTIYPGYVGTYTGLQRQIVKRKADDEKSQSSAQSDEFRRTQSSTEENTSSQNSFKNYQQNQFPNGQQVAIDYTKSTVNISQIITDFKNTTTAIGAPDDVAEEVLGYLSLIETQAQKDEPNKQIIRSNLKNASKVLDTYITKTLNKDSNVVENWIDALFLQKIGFKADSNALNPDFQVQIPQKKSQETGAAAPLQTKETTTPLEQTATAEEQSQGQTEEQAQAAANSGVYIPQDKELRRMFLQGKKYAAIGQDEKAESAFAQAIEYAEGKGDTQAQSIAYYELGQIYDRNDYLPEALESYQNAITNSQDSNLKARSFISMGKIYDDAIAFEPAVDHYFAAISFAGEADNLNAQTKALTNLADMYCEKYDKENTFQFLDLANGIAESTQNPKVIAATFGRSANMSERLDENAAALNYYRESTRYYTQTDSTESIVKNYRSAAGIMLKLGETSKARTLLEKAYIKGQDLNDSNLTNSIGKELISIS